MPKETSDKDFESVLKEKKAVVDFWAAWCGPCKMIAPTFEELSKEMEGVGFYKLDVEANQETAGKYRVMSIPTLIMFKDGKEAGRVVGALPKEALKQKIQDAFA